MKPLLAYLAICVTVVVWAMAEARYEELKRARAQLDAYKRRSRSP